MTLEELLDELRENVLHDDSGLASGPDDHLWSDDTLVRYLNDAERRFARYTFCLRDASTPEVVEVPLSAGISTYTLHPSVRAVISGRYEDDQIADLGRVGHTVMQELVPPETLVFDANSVTTLTPGRPRAISTDESLDMATNSSVVLTVYPEPTSTETGKRIFLRVARLPLELLTLDDTTASPEVPEEFHLDLCEWVGYRCFRTADLDGASDKASQHETRFTAAIDEAKRDARRKLFVPAAFKFGAFSWS